MNSIATFFKNFTLAKKILLFMTPLLAVFVGVKESIYGLGLLILLDAITGIRKSHYLEGVTLNPLKKECWKNVKSYLLRQTWRKCYEYIIGILAIGLLEVYFFEVLHVKILTKTNSLTKWGIIVAGLIEFWSIFENLEAVSGLNPLKLILNFLPDNVRKFFQGIEDAEEKQEKDK